MGGRTAGRRPRAYGELCATSQLAAAVSRDITARAMAALRSCSSPAIPALRRQSGSDLVLDDADERREYGATGATGDNLRHDANAQISRLSCGNDRRKQQRSHLAK